MVDSPAWLEHQTRKRTIPNHLVSKRKTGFQISTTGASKKDIKNGDYLQSSNSFNLVSFGGSPRKLNLESRTSTNNIYDTTLGDITKYDETKNKPLNDEFSHYEFENDAPPSKSIYDLNDEILLSLDKPKPSDSVLNKNPRNYKNVFNKNGETLIVDDKQEDKIINPLQHGESGILVFGYPENMSNQVIQHFQQFGNILEDFEVNKIKKNLLFQSKDKIFPCFMGPSWVKITYDNPASAMDSLQENGSIFNGILLGVIPYTKDAIEKLQNRKLSDNEDIGSGIEQRSAQKPIDILSESTSNNNLANHNNNNNGVKSLNHGINQPQPNQTNVTKLEIKDGSDFFLKPNGNNNNVDPTTSNSKEKLGYWDTTMKFLFGFNEL